MSTYLDGLSQIYSITNQINQLKAAQAENPEDPSSYILKIETSFSDMLNNLMFSYDNNEDDDKKTYDPFSSSLWTEQATLSLGLDGSANPGLTETSGLDLLI